MEAVIPLDQLQLSEYRPTGGLPKDTPELRRRIRDYGFVNPVVVRQISDSPRSYEILCNPESYVAAGKLGLDQIPVIVRQDLCDADVAEIVRSQYSQVTSNPIEEAEWYQEQLDEETSVLGGRPNIARLARKIGKSRSHISRSLALLTLPLSVQQYFIDGRLSAAHGRFLCKLPDALEQRRLADRAVRESLSVRDLEAIVNGEGRAANGSSSPANPAIPSSQPTATKDPDMIRLEDQLTGLVGCPVSIDHSAGLLSIQYFRDVDLLEGVMEKLGYSIDSY